MSQISKQFFWLEENGRYVLGQLSEGYPDRALEEYLPQLPKCDEKILKDLSVNYVVDSDNMLSIFDPKVVEWEEITAPILKVNGFERIVDFKGYTGRKPSIRMLKAAQKYYDRIKKQIDEVNLSNEKKDFENYFKTMTSDGISIWWWQEDWTYLRPSNLDGNYFFFDLSRVILDDIVSIQGLIILISAVEGKNSIILKVPKRFVGRIIGKGVCNVKRLEKKLGVHITVAPETE